MKAETRKAADSLTLWWDGLSQASQDLIDPSGSLRSLLDQRTVMLRDLTEVEDRLFSEMSGKLTKVPATLRIPIEDIIKALDERLNHLVVYRCAFWEEETDTVADMLRRACGYAVEEVGYPPDYIRCLSVALVQLTLIRAAAAKQRAEEAQGV